jgi:acetamidase/formamidase
MSDLHVPSTAKTLRWGRLPSATAAPVAEVCPDTLFTVDTLSHEGALEDQGRDPAAFFSRYGVTPLPDLLDALPHLNHDPRVDGPHLVTGPIHVDGARPGDLLQIDIVELERRTDYGVISDRHAKDVFAADPSSRPHSSLVGCDLVSTFCRVVDGLAVLDGDQRLRVPVAPFLGIVGVAPDSPDEPHSGPPGPYGGNLDLRHLVAGTSLFLPVYVPGALLYLGDPHFVQANGELASTALEAPLHATLRVVVHSGKADCITSPVARTAEHWIVCGLDRDLGRAVRSATASAIGLLGNAGVGTDLALAWLSVAGDVEVTQVVDGVLGAHIRLPRNVDLLRCP